MPKSKAIISSPLEEKLSAKTRHEITHVLPSNENLGRGKAVPIGVDCTDIIPTGTGNKFTFCVSLLHVKTRTMVYLQQPLIYRYISKMQTFVEE